MRYRVKNGRDIEAPRDNHEDANATKRTQRTKRDCSESSREGRGEFLLLSAIRSKFATPLRAIRKPSQKCRSVFPRVRFSGEIPDAGNSLYSR